MKSIVSIAQSLWQVDFSKPLCVAIPLDFVSQQPSAFGLPRASMEAFRAGTFVGDVRQGGPVNCFTVQLTPHGNGTHTECVGHLTHQRVHVHEQLKDVIVPASVVSISLAHADAITREMLSKTLSSIKPPFLEALLLRTLPNSAHKTHKQYSGNHPAFLEPDAMLYLREMGVRHLLVDVPSVDPEIDEGKLTAHHLFWECDGSNLPKQEVAQFRSITEMIYVPDDILDGAYLLNLQIAPFLLDAAPSRPVLFSISSVEKESWNDFNLF